MKPGLRHMAATILHAGGYYGLRRRVDARRGRRLLVLMYHDILDDAARGRSDTIDDDSPTAAEFAAHIDAVARRFRMVSLAQAVDELEGPGLAEDSVAFTFDDGYAAVHRHALPVLRRHAAPATLFVLTGWIDGMSFWWHRLRSMVAAAPRQRLAIEKIAAIVSADLSRRNGNEASDRCFRVRLAGAIEDALRDLRDADREPILDRLQSEFVGDVAPPDTSTALSWDQIEELARQGVELAAHTHSHLNFRYADPESVAAELARSRDLIARHTDRPVIGFAYPYGKDLDSYTRFESLLREHGFRYACTASPGNNRETQLLALRRVAPPSTRSKALIDHALCSAFVRDPSFYDMRTGR